MKWKLIIIGLVLIAIIGCIFFINKQNLILKQLNSEEVDGVKRYGGLETIDKLYKEYNSETKTLSIKINDSYFWNGTGYEKWNYGLNNGTFRDYKGTIYTYDNQGYFNIYSINNSYMGSFAFGVTGDVLGINYTYSSLNFTWTWDVYHNTFSNEYIFTAYNNNPSFNWTQIFHFYPDKKMKINNIITNNIGQTIENTKFWYLNTFTNNYFIEYQGNRYYLNNSINLAGNLTPYIPNVNFGDNYVFNYSDVINNGFEITNFYIGSGSVIGIPGINITAIGITKNNGTFPNSVKVDIDPSIEVESSQNISVLQLISPLVNQVSAGENVLVAEFMLKDYLDEGNSLVDNVSFYNLKDNNKSILKPIQWKYATDYEVEVCEEELSLGINCYNTTETNWTLFSSLSELPNKNIRIGLFTNTIAGEKIEWIPTIAGFEILEWASWDVTTGFTREFDTFNNLHNSMVKINNTHYLVTYQGAGSDGFASILMINSSLEITNISQFEFDTSDASYNSLVQIDETHYLNVYNSTDKHGTAMVLGVNLTNWTISNLSSIEFDNSTSNNQNKIVKINDTHYLVTHVGDAGYGFARVLYVNPADWSITQVSWLPSFVSNYVTPSLVKINNTHYIVAYQGNANRGRAEVLSVNLADWTISAVSNVFFDYNSTAYFSMQKINDTHYFVIYGRGSSYLPYTIILQVDNSFTVTNVTEPIQITGLAATFHSMVKINDTHYLDVFRNSGAGNDGFAMVLEVLPSWTVNNVSMFEFDIADDSYNSLVQINQTQYINAYQGVGSDGFAIGLNVEIPVAVGGNCWTNDGTLLFIPNGCIYNKASGELEEI
jgi:hypothetical protein